MENEQIVGMLVDIQTKVARIEESIRHLDQIDDRSISAYNLAKKNEEEIGKLKNSLQWATRTSIGAIITVVTGLVTIWLGGH